MRSLAWIVLAACSPGHATARCSSTLAPGDLAITEVFADYANPGGGDGSDAGQEWFEIYNTTARPIALDGLELLHGRPDGSNALSHAMRAATIAAGSYFTLGDTPGEQTSAFLDYGYGADLGELYNTDGGKLSLECGGTEIDAVVYDGVRAGHSRELSSVVAPDATLNDDPASWCEADATEFEPGNFGTPGGASDCAVIVMGACDDAGAMRAIAKPAPGALVISEIMPNPKIEPAQEWFEIANTGAVPFDLNELGLDRAGDTRVPDVILSAPCLSVAPGGFALFARSSAAAANGMLPPVDATFGFTMIDTGAGDVRVLDGDTVLDAVTWTTSTDGVSSQVAPGELTTAANDSAAGFCPAIATYGDGTNKGTPKAANACM